MWCNISDMPTTPTQALIDMKLRGRTLEGLVTQHRKVNNSWQIIADEIRRLTGVIVSRETVRNWYPELWTSAIADSTQRASA